MQLNISESIWSQHWKLCFMIHLELSRKVFREFILQQSPFKNTEVKVKTSSCNRMCNSGNSFTLSYSVFRTNRSALEILNPKENHLISGQNCKRTWMNQARRMFENHKRPQSTVITLIRSILKRPHLRSGVVLQEITITLPSVFSSLNVLWGTQLSWTCDLSWVSLGKRILKHELPGAWPSEKNTVKMYF